MKYKFPRRLRLTTETQFKKVYKERQKIAAGVVTIYRCYNSADHPRLGVVVAKSRIKSAVKRNYLKRIIREVFRLNQHQLKNIDIVIFVNSEAENLSRKELQLFLEKQLSKLE